MQRDDVPNLDIRISPGQPGRYSVEMQIGEREFPIGTMGQEVLDAGTAGQADEGVRLFRALVADVALRSAWDQAGALHPRRRIRLRIDDAAPELHTLAWEMLHDPSPAAAVRFLAADLDTPFSRYVACPWEPLGSAQAPLKVLTAIAAPSGLENYNMAAIDRAREEAILAEALARAPAGLVQHTALSGPCTLAALAAELERGYHVLHLLAHGAVNSDRTGSVMFLEKDGGGIERVDAARFARAIDCLSRSLRLAVLMSCNTATRSPIDARFGFAPSLLAAGVPAVLAMQDLMPMPTAAAFTRAFYEELWQSGQIDRAANRARRVVVTERLPGNAVPALYATRMSLELWTPETGPNAQVLQGMSVKIDATAREPEPEVEHEEVDRPEESPELSRALAAFGGPFQEFQVVRGAGGCLQAFGVDDERNIKHRRELAPEGEWSEWEQFGTEAHALTVAADPRGRVAVLILDGEGTVWLCTGDPAGKWTAWENLEETGDLLAAVYRKDGSLVVIAQSEKTLTVGEQKRPGGPWHEPYELTGGVASMLAVRNGADHIELFGVEHDGTLSGAVQRRPYGEWDDWSTLGDDVRRVFAVVGSDGRVGLFKLDVDQRLAVMTEAKPGGEWSDWDELAEDVADATAVWPRGGPLYLLTIDGGSLWGRAFHGDEDSGWEHLGGAGLSQVRAVETASGRIEVFALDESGTVFRLVLTTS